MKFGNDAINRFLSLVQITKHEVAKKFLSFDSGSIKTLDIALKNNENKDELYNTHMMILYKGSKYGELIYFKDEADTVFSDDDLEFIKSILNKRLEGLPLIYKNNLRFVYEEGGLENEHIKISTDSPGSNSDIYIVIRCRTYTMSSDDSDLSDDLWNILCNDKNLMLNILKYYMKDSKCFSSNIQKRIQSYYDSLTDSEKLLLELEEEI